MDEVGCSIQHSDQPNLEVHPFIYCKDLVAMQNPENHASEDPSQRITYSILWPKTKIEKESILYRDFLPRITEDAFRSARLCVWFVTPEKYYKEAIQAYRDEARAIKSKSEEFDQKYEENQSMDKTFLNELKELDRPVKIYSDLVSLRNLILN